MIGARAAQMLLVLAWSAGRAWAGAPSPPAREGPISAEEYRRFAMQHDGDAARGKEVFADERRLACTKCHSTDGKSGRAGPDLSAVGDQFARRELIEAVVRPSATIAVGYGTTIVETASGDEHLGVLKEATDTWIELACGDGQRRRVSKDSIAELRSGELSLMPEGLQDGLSPREFTDLIEFLVSLKEPAHAVTSHHGMPDNIAPVDPLVALRPFLAEPLPVPSPGLVAGQRIQSGVVWFAQVPGCSNVFLALDQSGIIWRIHQTPTGDRRGVFVDLTPDVFSASGPNGLLGLAFHPRFRENRKYYLNRAASRKQFPIS